MRRFLFWTLFFTGIGAFALHFGFELPYISLWFGKLPGDILLRKQGLVYHFPLTSSALISVVITSLFSLLPSRARC